MSHFDEETLQARLAAVEDVEDDASAADLFEALRAEPTVFLDTEFERTSTYYPRLALLQFAAGTRSWRVDPLALTDASGLRALLEDPGVRKVIHGCSEDVEVLAHWSQAEPRGLLDTQLAAAFLGGRFGIGYGELVEAALGIALDKGQTRSDWLRRPLSDAQRRYAALDVILLAELYPAQLDAIRLVDRETWVLEETAAVVADALQRPSAVPDWRAVKGAANLPPRGLAAASALAAWREERARTVDRPRARVLRDEHLLRIAEAVPADARSLGALDVPEGLKRHAPALCALMEGVRAMTDDELPRPPGVPAARRHAPLLKRLRAIAQAAAQEIGMAPELLARRRLVERWVETDDGALPDAWLGWRWPLVGERMHALCLEAGLPLAAPPAREPAS